MAITNRQTRTQPLILSLTRRLCKSLTHIFIRPTLSFATSQSLTTLSSWVLQLVHENRRTLKEIHGADTDALLEKLVACPALEVLDLSRLLRDRVHSAEQLDAITAANLPRLRSLFIAADGVVLILPRVGGVGDFGITPDRVCRILNERMHLFSVVVF